MRLRLRRVQIVRSRKVSQATLRSLHFFFLIVNGRVFRTRVMSSALHQHHLGIGVQNDFREWEIKRRVTFNSSKPHLIPHLLNRDCNTCKTYLMILCGWKTGEGVMIHEDKCNVLYRKRCKYGHPGWLCPWISVVTRRNIFSLAN